MDAHTETGWSCKAVGYSDSDWAGDAGSWKSQSPLATSLWTSSSELVLEATVGDCQQVV